MDTLCTLFDLARPFLRRHLGALIELARAGYRWVRSKFRRVRDAVAPIVGPVVQLVRRTLLRRSALASPEATAPPDPAPAPPPQTASASPREPAPPAAPSVPVVVATPIAFGSLLDRARAQLARC